MATTLTSDAEVLEQIEAFCAKRNISLTSFGRQAIGDGNLVGNLRSSRSLTLKTARKVIDFMADYVPPPAEQTPAEQAAA